MLKFAVAVTNTRYPFKEGCATVESSTVAGFDGGRQGIRGGGVEALPIGAVDSTVRIDRQPPVGWQRGR